MTRKYYVYYPPNFKFGNVYSLYYAETEKQFASVPIDAERVTRKAALVLARAERNRRLDNPSFSGYADANIYPADYPNDKDIYNDHRYQCINHIWEKIKEDK